MKRPLLLTTLMFVVASLVAGCGGGTSDTSSSADVEEEALAARIDDWTLSKQNLYAYIASLPEQQRAEFETHKGRADVAARFMEEELYYREGLEVNVVEKEWVQAQLEDARRRIIIGAYFKEHIEPQARPTEEEIHEYYEAHHDVYTTLEVCRAQHVFAKSKEKLDEIKVRVVDGGEPFTTMAHKYSEDKITQRDGGDLGYFNPGGYIRGVGYSQTFSDAVFQMELGVLYGPIEWEKGYSLVIVSEKRPAELRPYADVREEISDLLTKDQIENAKAATLIEIAQHYNTHNYMDEYFRTVQRSPEELFALAAASSDPNAQIAAYQQVIDKWPDHEMTPKALFMIGFVYAEGLSDIVMADKTFTKVINFYPETEMAETARWMRDNLGDELPEFQNVDELNKRVQEQND